MLAWRSEDSVESAKSSQSEAQPGSGSSEIPEADQFGGTAQGQYRKIHKTNDKGVICKRQQRETCWIGDRGNVNLKSKINLLDKQRDRDE